MESSNLIQLELKTRSFRYLFRRANVLALSSEFVGKIKTAWVITGALKYLFLLV